MSNENNDSTMIKGDITPNQQEESKVHFEEHKEDLNSNSSNSDSSDSDNAQKPTGVPVISKFAKRRSVEMQRKNADQFKPRLSVSNTPSWAETLKKFNPRVPPNIFDSLRRSGDIDAELQIVYQKKEVINHADTLWNIFVLLANAYCFLSCFYTLGIPHRAEGFTLFCEIISEFILLIDFFIFLITRWMQFPPEILAMSQPYEFSYVTIGRLLISSFPMHTGCIMANTQIEEFPYCFLKLFKLLRSSDMVVSLDKWQSMMKGTSATTIQLLKYLLLMLFMVHAMSSIWILAVRFQTDGWLAEFGYDKASYFELYSVSIFMVISNMSQICFGDTFAITVSEMLVYCLIVFVGCTALAALFGNLANSIYIQNLQTIKNSEKVEQIKNLALTRGLPPEFRKKLIDYYSLVHVKFRKYESNYSTMEELPSSLGMDLAYNINYKFIQQVKLFQQSDIGFIKAIVSKMKPMICLEGDYIIRKGEIAKNMYFIKKGIVKTVCADNDNMAISYMNKGCYFGEIGVLITGKRSVSVIAQTDCILYSLEKDEFRELLNKYPSHKMFFESVGRQRMLTTSTMDLLANIDAPKVSAFNPKIMIGKKKVVVQRSKLHLVLKYSYYLALLWALLWNLIYTPFAICFNDYTLDGSAFAITMEVISYIIYIGDIPIQFKKRIKLSQNEDKKGKENLFNFELFLDIIAIIPLDYIFSLNGMPCPWLRLIQMLKLHRVSRLDKVLHSLVTSLHLYYIIILTAFYILASHIFACIMYLISNYEFSRGGRFDGKSLFVTVVSPCTTFLKVQEAPIMERYVHFIYFMVTVMSSAVFGDMYPMTALEQIFVCMIMLISKIFLAFLYSEVANFMSSFYSSNIDHINKTKQIIKLLKINECNELLIGRVERYREFLWRKLKGIDDQSLISAMPETMKHQTQYHILEDLVKKAEVIPKNDYGAILSIIKELKIKLYPEGEFIIREGEIANEMFFLIEGTVDIYTNELLRIARINEGQCFGEMAILSDQAQIRTANAYCTTDVSVAVLKKQDLIKIFEAYPLFRKKLQEITEERKAINKSHTSGKLITQPMQVRERRTTMTFKEGIQKKLDEEKEQRGLTNKTKFRLQWSHLLHSCRVLACLYNILFIPVQMAFRIEYTAGIYACEALILCLHTLDLVLAIRMYKKNINTTFEIHKTQTKQQDPKKWSIIFTIVFEFITLLPFSMMLQDVYYPTYVIAAFKLLRILKMWPIRKVFDVIIKQWINIGRIIDIIVYYILIVHVINCLIILMMYVPPTLNDSWVKRVPTPYMDDNGYRTGNDMIGATWYEIYFHFAMQDENTVDIPERIVLTIYTIVYLYIFVFLFANVTSIVTDSTRGLMGNLQSRYEDFMQAINADALPKDLHERINDFFQFLWIDNKGIDDKCLEELPVTIRADILLFIHHNAFSSCKLFKNAKNEYIKGQASSFIKSGTFARCMKGDIVIKAGSRTKRLIFLLEGELVLVDLDCKVIGVIKPGDWFCQYDKKEGHSSCSVYVIASKFSRVIVMKPDVIDRLLDAFSAMKDTFFSINKIVMNYCNSYLNKNSNIETTAPGFDKVEDAYANLTQERIHKLVDAAISNEKDNAEPIAVIIEREKGQELSVDDSRRIMVETVIAVRPPSYYVDPQSEYYLIIYIVHMANMICTAIITPLQIGFVFKHFWAFYLFESLCLIESIIHVIIRLRTPVVMKGPTLSYDFWHILKSYREYGLVMDLFGLSPLNIILSASETIQPSWIIAPLRLIRVIMVANMGKIISYIQLRYNSLSSAINIITILISYFLLWHWISCFWLWINNYLESDSSYNWEDDQELDDSSMSKQYVYSIYYTIKIIAGVGSGESIPVTFLEKVVQYLFLRIGEIIFAVLFGQIAAFASSFASETEKGIIENCKIEDFTREFKLSSSDAASVKNYFSFLGELKLGPNAFKEIREQLPRTLAKECIYESIQHLITPMFKSIASDAFIMKLTQNLIRAYYMPGDYIVRKGDVGDEMYFLAEGRVAIVASNKRIVIKRLFPGCYFGDIALFLESKRICHVRAETCCCVYILKREVVEKIKLNFKKVAEKMADIGVQKLSEFKKKDTQESDIQEDEIELMRKSGQEKKRLSTSNEAKPLIKVFNCDNDSLNYREKAMIKKSLFNLAKPVMKHLEPTGMEAGGNSPKNVRDVFVKRVVNLANDMEKTKKKKKRLLRRLSQLNVIKKLETKRKEENDKASEGNPDRKESNKSVRRKPSSSSFRKESSSSIRKFADD